MKRRNGETVRNSEDKNESANRQIGESAKKPVRHFRDLEVYQNALAAGLRVYELTKRFPAEER
ncbi:MAG: four helix bundle protein, partial [Verrucomicrobia bacterium]|nr:four helix bundle protein [Verrucomicrobiota bacterium]